MLKIYENNNKYDTTYAYDVYENILYILVSECDGVNYISRYHLLKFDICKRLLICDINLGISSEYCHNCNIVNGILYVRHGDGNIVNIYDYRNKNSYSEPEVKKIKGYRGILYLMGETYYYIKNVSNNIRTLVNTETGEIFKTIKYNCDEASIDDENICTTTSEYGNFTCYDNKIIFNEDAENDYVEFNVQYKTVNNNKISDKYKFIITEEKFGGFMGNRKKVFYNGSKSKSENDVYDDITEQVFEYDYETGINHKIKSELKLKGNDYVDNRLFTFEYEKDIYYVKSDYECLSIFIDIEYTKLEFNSNFQHDKKITIGSETKNMKILTNILKYRLKNNMEIIKLLETSDSIIRDELKNIKVYHDFITTFTFKEEKLYNLFCVCKYLNDVDVKYVAELIISYVKKNDVDIDESFKYIEALFESEYYGQFKALVYVFFRKYNAKLIIAKLQSENTLLNSRLTKMILNDYFRIIKSY